MFLSYTIFADRECTEVRSVANLYGRYADAACRIFKRELGRDPKEGDKLFGCRIDRIGSEDASRSQQTRMRPTH